MGRDADAAPGRTEQIVPLVPGCWAQTSPSVPGGRRPRALRAHARDRAPAERDLADLEEELRHAPVRSETARATTAEEPRGQRPPVRCVVPATFDPGTPVPVEVTVQDDVDRVVDLHYRPLDQGERWSTVTMAVRGHRHGAAVPAATRRGDLPLTAGRSGRSLTCGRHREARGTRSVAWSCARTASSAALKACSWVMAFSVRSRQSSTSWPK